MKHVFESACHKEKSLLLFFFTPKSRPYFLSIKANENPGCINPGPQSWSDDSLKQWPLDWEGCRIPDAGRRHLSENEDPRTEHRRMLKDTSLSSQLGKAVQRPSLLLVLTAGDAHSV